MKIFTVVGARPQFVKASVVSKEISNTPGLEEILLHTGQHFDQNMSDIFFNELKIPKPTVVLGVNGGSHGEMTGKMLIEIEKELLAHKPDRVLVYGDTNSTLAGALAAAKLHIPVAHVEAGLRSFNLKMPEEINRILTDQISDTLFCPTDSAIANLNNEGFGSKKVKILKVGDVMQDSAMFFAQSARPPQNFKAGTSFVLATIHRAENTDTKQNLENIVKALNYIHQNICPVVLPIHPRTKKTIASFNLSLNVEMIDPVGYLEMLWLLKNSSLVLTDSGGVQKEAYFFGKACVTLRNETEWTELVSVGANVLVGADYNKIVTGSNENLNRKVETDNSLYGGGKAAEKIVKALLGN